MVTSARYMFVSALFLCGAALLHSCDSTVQIEEVEDTFAVYLLRDTTLTANDAVAKPLSALQLADTAFILVSDLTGYRWAEHTFTVKEQLTPAMDLLKQRKNVAHGVPFVIVVGIDRIYLGTFWWTTSSSIPPACAVIDILSGPPYAITLPQGAPEYRNDARIRTSLMKYGVLIE
ncbi:MAG: hypothetical protein HUU02_05555 [Bacteroidetes bacterium]|nr:hypothetical protein [Bacteroidota bacterium]